MPQTFRDLRIWQKGYELLMKIYEITSKYPASEKFNLVSQTQSSANGVIAAIAEAYGRFYFADKVRTLYVGRGECLETQSHLTVALGRGYITQKEFDFLDSEYLGLAKGVNSYIMNLRERKRGSVPA